LTERAFLFKIMTSMKKRLITSALPYVNNIPHLGNLIQVLSGDVFARFCRNRGHETFYACGTDEYGTATETRALTEGVTPQQLCDYYHAIHKEIYEWFNIQFDHFGRTSAPEQTVIVQEIFKKLDAAGYINRHTQQQLFCHTCDRFLADRYVNGTCPKCGYTDARGDQCDNCGTLLDPTELIDPSCSICGNAPHPETTEHLYINLPAIRPKLEAWLDETSAKGFWSHNAVAMSKSWIRDGLKERAITRDLKWGVPVPKKGFENKVFYVWFDAPIGYISITAQKLGQNYKTWWHNPDNVELFQFIGKDNIPFHTVIFPSSLLGSGDNWTMLYHMSSSEYLNYENEKFSKSRGVGVFGDDCRKTGIPADVWRFYIYYNRPEKSDTHFIWKDFAERVNGELIGNFSNFINRTLSFVHKFFNSQLPDGQRDPLLWQEAERLQSQFMEQMEKAEIKEALKTLLQLSSMGNKRFQEGEPWRTVKEEPQKAADLIFNLTYLVRDLALLSEIFIPETSRRILNMLNARLDWHNLKQTAGLNKINTPELLFKQLEDDRIEALRRQFSGSQEERKHMENTVPEQEKPNSTTAGNEHVRTFANSIDLRAAKITAVERHPDAENLYILQLDLGDSQRQIVSSIVPFYKEEELLNKTIVIVANLKKAKFRGTVSEGMLLAAGEEKNGEDHCEVIFTEALPGSRFLPEGSTEEKAKNNISSERFFSFPMQAVNGIISFENKPLKSAEIQLHVYKYPNESVG
jgi:methionyl-tRNA synthetase